MALSNGNSNTFLYTSESVGEGHPDKLCDQISDAILDAYLEKDPQAKVACECAVSNGLVMLIGEISSTAQIDARSIVKQKLKEIGYNSSEIGFDYNSCSIHNCLIEQNKEIANAVHINKSFEDIGAGDQGIMFGYATNETPEAIPITLLVSHRLNQKYHQLRKSGVAHWARPDSKAQVTFTYVLRNGETVPLTCHTIVMSVQHDEHVSNEEIVNFLKEKVIKAVIDEKYLTKDTIYHLQPSGRFIKGGPMSDAGLTGRKIIVDTYGGWGAHGGGAFSGKDYTKVDRSGAYAARWVAKSLLKAGLCKRVLVQLSYSIGISEPLSIFVDSYGTGNRPDYQLVEIIKKNFDLRPGAIAKSLDLTKPIYQKTAVYGHFGRMEFTWEHPKKLEY